MSLVLATPKSAWSPLLRITAKPAWSAPRSQMMPPSFFSDRINFSLAVTRATSSSRCSITSCFRVYATKQVGALR